jgi:serine/threonine protein kinase
MSTLKSGDKIGKYRMVELIGHGGMASVYRGMDEVLKRGVAINVLHPHLENRQEAKERFRREAQAIAKISHPNIVEIYDYSGEDSSQSFIVTQLVSGGSLRELKETAGEFPPEIAASIAVQVAEGLNVAHASGVVHRDIKPENLLLDKDGTVKVADFGIAHLADARDMTATGQILGSPYYMSPEQVTGDSVDERSDIFSFGSLLFWLATGKLAFDGANPHAVLRCIVEKEVEDVERLSPAIGRKLAVIIQNCLKKRPDERYPEFAAIAVELQEYLGQSGIDNTRLEVRQFIAAPEQYRMDRRQKSIVVWSEKAQELERQGRVQEAMDLYNRVLALDPDNEKVLGRLKAVRSAQSRRLALRWTVGLVLLVALLAGGYLLGTTFLSRKPGEGEGEKAGVTGGIHPPWNPIASYSEHETESVGSAGKEGGEEEAKAAGTELKTGKSNGGAAKAGKAEGPVKGGGAKSRIIRFVPFPKTVNILVDGKLLGAYFKHQETELSVGNHVIRFEPLDEECCEPAEWTVNVAASGPGAKEQIVGKRLVFKSSHLIVFSDKPGDVVIGGAAMGRTGEFIEIHLGDNPSKSVDVTVKAEVCEPWRSSVTLRAGKKSNIKAALQCP